MKAEVRHIMDMSFLGRADTNHWVPMDTTADTGGADAATKPIELVLLALGGCTAMDVVSILRKKRAPFTSFRVEIEADRATEHPQVFTRIHLVYRIGGAGVKGQDVADAVKLSQEKYCPVAAMLVKACPVTYEYKLEP